MTTDPFASRTSRSSKFGLVSTPQPEPAAPEQPPAATAPPPAQVEPTVDEPPVEAKEPAAGDEPEVEAKPAAKAPAKKATKKAPKKAATGTPEGAPPAEPAANKARMPEIAYAQDSSEARVKDWGMLPTSLMQTVEMTRMQWSVLNPEWLMEHGAPPHISGFKEALMRLGLKHINDPEFAALIPPDRRRGKVRRELDTLDE